MTSPVSASALSHPAHASKSSVPIISADEAGQLVGLSGRTIRRLCASGRIPNCVQLGRSWRINKLTFLELFGIVAD